MGDILPIKGTATSAFGVGKRENHDASVFYERFEPPETSDDETVVAADPAAANPLITGDARAMPELAGSSVALVVTSPPYFAGKEYEEALGEGHVPGSYIEYLELLRDVFAECKRVLEPGGRIAVNVANLGRKPYRSLSSDVIRILQDDLRLLLRGEIVWQKARGASGSAAWGSFRSASNPVLRDVTERVIVASKGRFGRARSLAKRRREELPHRNGLLTTDEFLDATLDLWEIPPESASRVGHPAPFPVELPQRLILLYSFERDLVLDPFLGSGSTAVAAVRTNRRYAGYDVDEGYVRLARDRVAAELGNGAPNGALAAAAAAAKSYRDIAEAVLERCGFTIIKRNQRVGKLSVAVPLIARDARGAEWAFDVTGAFTTTGGGLRRAEVMLKALGRAAVLRPHLDCPLVLLTSELPQPGSPADHTLRSPGPEGFFDAVEMLGDTTRLAAYGAGARTPLPGFWTPAELAR